jgi:ABC-type polysaccharide/polyol phosphate export permease
MEALGIKSEGAGQVDQAGMSRRMRDIVAGRMHYLDLVTMLVRRELKVKYRGSVLGYVWSMFNPLLFMIIISVVFSFLMRGIENYNLYVLSGILFWNMVTLSLNMGASAIVRNGPLMMKVRVPAWIFPVVPAGVAVTNFILSIFPYTILYAFSGRPVPDQIWLAPLLFVLTLGFLAGVAITLSVVNVFFRDVSHVMDPLLMLTFYATPVIYDRNAPEVPELGRLLLGLNPFTHFIEAFRAALFGGIYRVSPGELALLVAMTSASVVIGFLVYKVNRKKLIFYV